MQVRPDMIHQITSGLHFSNVGHLDNQADLRVLMQICILHPDREQTPVAW